MLQNNRSWIPGDRCVDPTDRMREEFGGSFTKTFIEYCLRTPGKQKLEDGIYFLLMYTGNKIRRVLE